MTDFAGRLNYALNARGMGVNQLEKLAKLSRGYASRLSHGRAQMPTVGVLKRIAGALQVTLEYLTDGKLPMLVEEMPSVLEAREISDRLARLEAKIERPVAQLPSPPLHSDRLGWGAIAQAVIEDDDAKVQDWTVVGAGERAYRGDLTEPVTKQEIIALAQDFLKSEPDEDTRKRLSSIALRVFAAKSGHFPATLTKLPARRKPPVRGGKK